MAFYRAPEGFAYDPSIGKYFKESLVETNNGGRQRVVVFFDPANGIYTQETIAGKKQIKHLPLKIILGLLATLLIFFGVNVGIKYASYKSMADPNNQKLINEQNNTTENWTITMEDYNKPVTGEGIFK